MWSGGITTNFNRVVAIIAMVVLFGVVVSGCEIVNPNSGGKAADGSGGANDSTSLISISRQVPILYSADLVFRDTAPTQSSTVTIDVNNVRGGGSSDYGVTYTNCDYDQVIDGVVLTTAADCSNLPGTASFSATTGILTWVPGELAMGTYEIGVVGATSGGSSSTVIVVTVREKYVTSNLVCDLDARFATYRTPQSNPTTSWLDLTLNGYNATLTNTAGLATSGWAGAGTAASPYRMVFDGTNDYLALGSSVIPAARNTMMLSTWINPAYKDASGKIIAGNGGYTGNGFALQQSDTSSGRVELVVGRKTYFDVVSADQPMSYWRLDETAGATVADASGSALDGTIVGAGVAYSATGPNASTGTSLTLSGATTITNIGNTNTYNFVQNTGVYSVEFWARQTDYTTHVDGMGAILGNASTVAGQKGFFVGYYPNIAGGYYVMNVMANAPAGWQGFGTGVGQITDNNWHYIAYVSDGTNVQAYKDGEPEGAPIATGGAFTVGASSQVMSLGHVAGTAM